VAEAVTLRGALGLLALLAVFGRSVERRPLAGA